MSVDDDDKPTVVLDLNALKKQKLKQEEDLANIVNDLEFAVGPEDRPAQEDFNSEDFAERFLEKRESTPAPKSQPKKTNFTVILFDFKSDFFQKSQSQFPQGYNYQIARNLGELNKFLAVKGFQIVVFNYDVNPKAVNQLSAQIKQKFPATKTLIMAKVISPEKAKIHARTPSGASGYCQFPINAQKVEAEFLKIQNKVKKVG